MEERLNIESRKFIIFNVSELHKVDFSAVCETSQYTVTKSVDKTKTFVKWETEEDPWFLNMLETKEGPYTIEEMREIISGPEWNPPLKK